MMLDTGAGDTCISTAVAQELGLQPIRTQRIFGVGGQKDHPVFLPEIIIELKQVDGHGFTMNRSQPAAGVDELEKLLEPISLARSDGWPTRLMGLLGRDFLRHMIMVYSGDAAEFRLFAQLGTLRAS
ncbi:MAG TPA: aspartyl protease family protein [Thermoanaerobaculaceae bacterium]|nr:aspartyl protease family protein [Thermoanaerobaculaceae bacterium]HPS77368.1 aspartyl protease family protein [Thermoanaerobaculaceae bacterium]